MSNIKERGAKSAYRAMWLMVMFDLPTLTKAQRRLHSRFRKDLEKCGFMRIQLSIYISHFASEDAAQSIRNKIKSAMPPEGHIRILLVTDRQFGKMEVMNCRRIVEREKPLPVVLLF